MFYKKHRCTQLAKIDRNGLVTGVTNWTGKFIFDILICFFFTQEKGKLIYSKPDYDETPINSTLF